MSDYINPLCINRRRTFSQFDEDGITLNILKRISIQSNPAFLEIGVGSGLENNTLLLAALGWRGTWLGEQSLDASLKIGARIHFIQRRVDVSFIKNQLLNYLELYGRNSLEVISVDVDSIDYYLVSEIFNLGLRPSVFIVEYNASFIPPIKYIMKYRPSHTWQGNAEFGASLSSWDSLFSFFGYSLIACSSSGVNAFFVSNIHKGNFMDVSTDIDDLYCPPHYSLNVNRGHEMSIRSINELLEKS